METMASVRAVFEHGVWAASRALSARPRPGLRRDERLTLFGMEVLDDGSENSVVEYGLWVLLYTTLILTPV